MNTFSYITFFLNYSKHYNAVEYEISSFCLLLYLPQIIRGKG